MKLDPGKLEGGGWAESLNMLVELPRYNMIWVVRKEILDEVIKKWKLNNPVIIDVPTADIDAAKESITKIFSE